MTSSSLPPLHQEAHDAFSRYAGIFQRAAVGMAVVSLDGHFLEVNQRLCDITGYSDLELLATDFQTLTHPEDLDADLQSAEQLLAGRIADYTLEKRYIRKDGEPTWVELTVSLLRDEADRPTHFVAVMNPIDARKTLEHQASVMRSKLDGFFNQAATGMAIVDTEGFVQECNERFCQVLGYPAVELRRRSFFGMAHNDDVDSNRSALRRLRDREIAECVLEGRFYRRDGSEVWCLLSASRVESEDEAPYICLVVKDISKRKELEAALNDANLRLELKVEERTRELKLAKQEAEEALRLAEDANRARAEFLSTLSHEIRTPLNAALGFGGLLLDSPLGEEQRQHAEMTRRANEKLLHLLNDFLDYSKIEAGHLELEPVDFDPREEMQQVLTLVEEAAARKGLALQHSVDAPALLRGDAGRLRQIVLNLLNNAIKFTERGQVQLRCEQMIRLDAVVWLTVEVSDTGIGIDPRINKKIFLPFTQGDASPTRRFGGTGLGLAICKRLAEAMGGNIGYRTTVGLGSTFWVSIPFLMQRENDVPARTPPDFHVDQPHKGRVLVVEDNPASQKLTAMLLERMGCRVDVAGDGREAVAAVSRLPYDLIIMDIDMPVMNGFDATRAIRALERAADTPPVPIVALTASALAGDKDRCMDVGMTGFLAKPVRPQALEQVVRMWLKPAVR